MRHTNGRLQKLLVEAHESSTADLLLVQSRYMNCKESKLQDSVMNEEQRIYHAVEAKLSPALSRMEKTLQMEFPCEQLILGKAVDLGLKRQEHHDSAGA